MPLVLLSLDEYWALGREEPIQVNIKFEKNHFLILHPLCPFLQKLQPHLSPSVSFFGFKNIIFIISSSSSSSSSVHITTNHNNR